MLVMAPARTPAPGNGFTGTWTRTVTVTGSPVYLKEINDYLKGGMLTLGAIAFAAAWLVHRLTTLVRASRDARAAEEAEPPTRTPDRVGR